MIVRTSALVCFTALLAACGPIPGGELEGSVVAAPAEWSSVLEAGHAFCEIESRPAEPHSIQLDCFLHDGQLYVQSHRWALAPWWPTESWAAVWLEHPAVGVRIDASIFELRAVHVTDDTRTPILEARGYDPVPEGIALFRFDPRR